MGNHELVALSSDLNNWLPMRELSQQFPKFTYQQIKVMFWRKEDKPGLDRCARMVGRTQYINHRLFGLWLAGQLPEQQARDAHVQDL